MRDERDEHLTQDDPWETMRQENMRDELDESRYGWERAAFLDRVGLGWSE